MFGLLFIPTHTTKAGYCPLDATACTALAAQGTIWILTFFGTLIGFIIDMILTVASYNDFINAPAVIQGWTVVRDLGNMGFIVILLIIGFGSMFSKFEIGQYLPRVVIYSILVNFSRTICGLLIDASQVVMLTFVNAFKDAGAGNFVNALGLDKIVSLAQANSNATGDNATVQILLATMLGVVLTMLALGILGALLLFLVERVVGLWVLVAISPAAFILRAVPFGKAGSMATQWQTKFTTYLTTGPILAFFLWLALSISSTVGPASDQGIAALNGLKTGQTNAAAAGDLTGADVAGAGTLISNIGNSQGILNFIISAAMLVYGMGIAKSAGGMAGSFVGKFQGAGALGKIGLGKGGIGRKLATLGPVGSYVGGVAKGVSQPFVQAYKNNALVNSFSKKGERLGLAGVALPANIPGKFISWRDKRDKYKKAVEVNKNKGMSDVDAARQAKTTVYGNKPGFVRRAIDKRVDQVAALGRGNLRAIPGYGSAVGVAEEGKKNINAAMAKEYVANAQRKYGFRKYANKDELNETLINGTEEEQVVALDKGIKGDLLKSDDDVQMGAIRRVKDKLGNSDVGKEFDEKITKANLAVALKTVFGELSSPQNVESLTTAIRENKTSLEKLATAFGQFKQPERDKMANALGKGNGYEGFGGFVISESKDNREMRRIMTNLPREMAKAIAQSFKPTSTSFSDDRSRVKAAYGASTKDVDYNQIFDFTNTDQVDAFAEAIEDGELGIPELQKMTTSINKNQAEYNKILAALKRKYTARKDLDRLKRGRPGADQLASDAIAIP